MPDPLESRVQILEKNDAVHDVEIAALKESLDAQTSALKELVALVADTRTKGLIALVFLLGGDKALQALGIA